MKKNFISERLIRNSIFSPKLFLWSKKLSGQTGLFLAVLKIKYLWYVYKFFDEFFQRICFANLMTNFLWRIFDQFFWWIYWPIFLKNFLMKFLMNFLANFLTNFLAIFFDEFFGKFLGEFFGKLFGDFFWQFLKKVYNFALNKNKYFK